MGGIFPGLVLGAGAGLLLGSAMHHGFNRNDQLYEYNYYKTINGTDYHIQCFCKAYNPCGCDEPSDDDFLNNMPQGKYAVGNVDGNQTIQIDGTLENDTDASASGSSAASSASSTGSSSGAGTNNANYLTAGVIAGAVALLL